MHYHLQYVRFSCVFNEKGVISSGTFASAAYKLYLSLAQSDGRRVSSFWHDVACYTTGLYDHIDTKGVLNSMKCVNFVNEIPLGSRYKMEVSKTVAHNPLTHDSAKKPPPFLHIKEDFNDKIRYTKYGVPFFGYGCVPQTLSTQLQPPCPRGIRYGAKIMNYHTYRTDLQGDNDPLDIIDISDDTKPLGLVYAVKVLGAIPLVDQGELDWKIVAIDVDDPMSPEINGMTQV